MPPEPLEFHLKGLHGPPSEEAPSLGLGGQMRRVRVALGPLQHGLEVPLEFKGHLVVENEKKRDKNFSK